MVFAAWLMLLIGVILTLKKNYALGIPTAFFGALLFFLSWEALGKGDG